MIGHQSDRARVTAHWIDSWHMSDGVMPCEGRVDPDGSTVVRGSYAAPPDQDWGWRIEVKPVDTTTLTLTMYNITPTARKRWPSRPDTNESDHRARRRHGGPGEECPLTVNWEVRTGR